MDSDDKGAAVPSVAFLGIEFTDLTQPEILNALVRMSRSDAFQYVVTPNVDHLVNLAEDGPRSLQFRQAYENAAMRLCDSRILQKLARMKKVNLPLFPGSDLTAVLFKRIFQEGDTVAIIGGHSDMIGRLERICPRPRYIQHIPPFGIMDNPEAIEAVVAFLKANPAHYILFAIGAPQSEIISLRCLEEGGLRGVALCIGASIEFIIGQKKRAPEFLQRLSLEWLYRLLSEPQRLWRRYLVDGMKIFRLYARGRVY